MQTETTTQDVILSEEKKTKVSLIGDINKLNLLLCKRPLSTEEFERLYDYSITELYGVISAGEHAVNLTNTLERLGDIVKELGRDKGLEDGN